MIQDILRPALSSTVAMAVNQTALDIAEQTVFPLSSQKAPSCWFTVWQLAHGTDEVGPVAAFAIGAIPTTKGTIYPHFANEQAERLLVHPDHLSSWESRDVSGDDELQHSHGGAIRGMETEQGDHSDVIVSSYGLSEHLDEMLCVLTMYLLHMITLDRAAQIAEFSENEPLMHHLREQYL
ncbi:MAG: hypothetical protein HOE53_01035 [Candidatus Magasanikbacteria bacterium]|nr:hypothetical protein [Candidatus Magasanikbacteria bacterium]